MRFRVKVYSRFFVVSFLFASLLGPVTFAGAQQSSPASPDQATTGSPDGQGSQEADPLKRPLSEKQKKENAKRFKKEISKTYKKWLDEDVIYIITPEERQAFMQLSNDEERDNFIEAFWQRRDPTPDTPENEFKEEHYRRIEYANEHFAAGIPGWKTDRGRIYIIYGQPDEIDSHPSGGIVRASDRRGRRRDFDLSLRRLALSLSRRHRTGSHHRVRRYLHVRRVPHDHGPQREGRAAACARRRSDQYEQMGMAARPNRFNRGGLEQTGAGPRGRPHLQTKEFDRLEQFAKLKRRPRSSSRIWRKSSVTRSAST